MLERFWLWVAYVVAVVASWAAGVHDVFFGLLLLQAIDIFTGVLYAMRSRTFRSAIGRAGIQRRLATWALIMAVSVMQYRTGILQPPTDAQGMQAWGAAEWVAAAMSVIEFTSIAENAKRLGVNVPGWLLTAMDKAKTVLGLEPREPGEGGK